MEQVQILFSFYLSDHYSITKLLARKFQPSRMGININNRKFTINLAPQWQRRKKSCNTFLYCHIFSPLNMSWSKPSSLKTLAFLYNDAIKVCVSRLCSRCIVTLTLNNYMYNLFLRFVSGFLVQIINHNSG